MKAPPSPPDEAARLKALRQYGVLDTAPEQTFDDLTHLAAQICATPISAIALLDQERLWFKSRVGLEAPEIPRDTSFCAHAILEPDLLLVPDTFTDERFADNPQVTAEPHIRFYAGVPLLTPEGQAVGTLCVLDTVPRQLDQAQEDALLALGRQVVALLEGRPDAKAEKGQSRQARRESEEQGRTLAAAMARQDADRLKASEERYRRLFEAAKDGILILDATTGRIEDVNPFLCQLLGYAPEELLGKQLWEIGTFRDIAANQDAFNTLQEKGYIRHDDLPLETKEGESVSVEFVSNVYMCAVKKVIQCNIRNISERKQALVAKQEAQQLLQSTLDALASHIAVLDQNGRIIAVNKAWQQFCAENGGTAVSCGMGANYLEVCDQASGPWAEEAPAVAQAIREMMAGRQEIFSLEYPCHSAKEERWFNACVTRFNGEGPVRVVVSHETITARKRAEVELEGERDFTAAVIDTVGNLVVVLDRQGHAVRFNRACEQLSGYTFDEVKDKNLLELVLAPEEAEEVKAAFKDLCAGHFPNTHENSWLAKDGSRSQISWTNTALLDPAGAVEYVICTGMDLTERQQSKKEKTQLHSEIEQQRQRLNTLVASVPGVVWEAWGAPDDSKQRIDFVSKYVTTMLGYSVEEWLATPNFWLTIVHPDDREQAGREAAALFASGRGGAMQFRWLTKDGRVVWVESQITVTCDATGCPLGMRGVNVDITERKQAESQLTEKISELQRWYNITIDREDRILDLKREVNDLLGKAGKPLSYPSAELAEK